MCGVNKVKKFIKESYGEIKKIQFPTKKEAIRLTGYVVGVSLASGLLVTLFDFVFKKLLTFIVTK